MSFISIGAAVKTKLLTLVGSGQPLAQVLDYHTDEVSGFPAVTFEASGNENAYVTTVDNVRDYSFDVFVHQEISLAQASGGLTGRAAANYIVANAVDQIIQAFDEDFTLGGACHMVAAVPSGWGTYLSGKGPTRYAKITIKCLLLVDIEA